MIAGLARTQFADIEAARARSGTPRARASTPSSRPPTSTSFTSCRRRARTCSARRAPPSRTRASFVEDVEFSPMDATRSEIEFTAEVVAAAIEEGATHDQHPRHRRLRDAARVRRLARRASTSSCRRCAAWCSRCTATTTSGWPSPTPSRACAPGARQVECAINGIGERAGNASLEEIVMLLHTRAADIGLRTGINTREIARTSRLVSRLTGYACSPTRRSSAATPSRTSRASTRTACSRSARPTRSWRRRASGWPQLARARQALRAPRAAPGAREPRHRGLRGRR